MIAELPLYSRTPVQMYQSERIGNMKFAVWYVRIRDHCYTNNTFDGILKLEKILVSDEQMEEADEKGKVSKNQEEWIKALRDQGYRAGVCYGADHRWANHLYPVYVTETFIKSKYLGESMFLNLF